MKVGRMVSDCGEQVKKEKIRDGCGRVGERGYALILFISVQIHNTRD